jgi:hypothetical protein
MATIHPLTIQLLTVQPLTIQPLPDRPTTIQPISPPSLGKAEQSSQIFSAKSDQDSIDTSIPSSLLP